MTEDKIKQIINSYERLKNLKLVEKETGIKWQTVYWHLKKAGIEVTGDKARYGSASDRVAVIGEQEFKRTVPFATDNNNLKYQASVDFSIGKTTIDIKTSLLQCAGRQKNGKSYAARWSYCINKQLDIADYFVFYGYKRVEDKPSCIFLIPNDLVTNVSTLSIPLSLKSKWADYQVTKEELNEYFLNVFNEEKKSA